MEVEEFEREEELEVEELEFEVEELELEVEEIELEVEEGREGSTTSFFTNELSSSSSPPSHFLLVLWTLRGGRNPNLFCHALYFILRSFCSTRVLKKFGITLP